MLGWWLTWTALAGVPDGLRPVVAPLDVQQTFDRWAARSGEPGGKLACDPLWETHAMLCFRVWEEGKRRWVTTADVARWQVTVPELRAAVVEQAAARVQLEERPIADMSASWWLLADGDGWAAAGVLAPDAVQARLGGPFRAAMPAEGVFVAWRAGDTDVDKVMAVAVAELYGQHQGPVSSIVYAWDGERWLPWGRAEPAK